ncbi:MAG: hypothetical protein HY376_01920 [Candidatus Blackburnbacteria bacterium]|nr:hypothetical protein [Candidatus Blackburnbacteria bacterium]
MRKKNIKTVNEATEPQRTVQVFIVDTAKVLPTDGYMLLDDLASFVGCGRAYLQASLRSNNATVCRVGRKYLVNLADVYEKLGGFRVVNNRPRKS